MIVIRDTRLDPQSIESYALAEDGNHDRYLGVVMKSGEKYRFRFPCRGDYDSAIKQLDSLFLGPKDLFAKDLV